MIRITDRAEGNFDLDTMPLYAMERAMGETEEIPNEGPTIPFKMYDDDGEYCYGGELTDDEECLNQVAALRYGESDYGATRIEVRREGKWIQEIA